MASPFRATARAFASPQKGMRESSSLPNIPQMMTFTANFPGLRRGQGQLQQDKLPDLPKFGRREIGTSRVGEVLTVYARVRQTIMDLTQSVPPRRVPNHVASELAQLEQELCTMLPAMNARFFQRLDPAQLARTLRSMPLQRLSPGRWLFGGDGEEGGSSGSSTFLILSGTVRLYYDDPKNSAEFEDLGPGVIFGRRKSHKSSGCDKRGIAAQAESNAQIGILSVQVLETAVSGGDRVVGDRRVEQLLSSLEIFRHFEFGRHIQELALQGQQLMVRPGSRLLTHEGSENMFMVVTKGTLRVRGSVFMEEEPKVEDVPQGRRKMKVFIERAKDLAGDSIFDKLDPYCVIKLGEYKRFQTPPAHNAGTDPIWKHSCSFLYDNEDVLALEVWDYDTIGDDDECGSGFLELRSSHLRHGFKGEVKLWRRKKKHMLSRTMVDEPAGSVFLTISWEQQRGRSAEELAKQNAPRKTRTWTNQVLFEIPERAVWGHEVLTLGKDFNEILNRATDNTGYIMKVYDFHVEAAEGKKEAVLLRFLRKDFLQFFKRHCKLEKLEAWSRTTALKKQLHIKEIAFQLIAKWRHEEIQNEIAMPEKPQGPSITSDLSRFRTAFRGTPMKITLLSAVNLAGGSIFDKLDPYAVCRLRGSRQKLRTKALKDVGPNPVWNHSGTLIYNGEENLELEVWDDDGGANPDDLCGAAELPLEKFVEGFEGMVELKVKVKKKKDGKEPKSGGLLALSIEWHMPESVKNSIDIE